MLILVVLHQPLRNLSGLLVYPMYMLIGSVKMKGAVSADDNACGAGFWKHAPYLPKENAETSAKKN